MLAYTVRRFAVAIPIVLASTFVSFVVVALSGSPLSKLRARNPPVPPRVIRLEKQRLYLDEPLLERYWIWLTGIVQGDFGPSTRENVQIGAELIDRWLTTMRLVGGAVVLALLLAVIVGVVSAVKQYTATDYTATFFGFLFLAMPTFWFAVLLKQAGISYNNATDSQTFYTIGASSVFFTEPGTWEYILDILGHMVLPTITLALISFAAWSRYQRAAMLEVLGSDYVRFARAKGLGRRRVLVNHALRTALIPLTTVVALDFSVIVSGAVITEAVFQWRGMGTFLLTSVREQDVFAVAGWLLLVATTTVVLNLIADLLYALLDPRMGYA